MDSVVTAAQKVNLGEDAIRAITEGKCEVLAYADLANYSTLQEAAGKYQAAICLFETKPSFGHWIAWFRIDDETWEWFDSYGMRPDSERAFIDEKFLKESGQAPFMTELIKRSTANTRLIWNQQKLQSEKVGVNTCGRWASLRIKKRGMKLAKFQELFVNQKESPDWLATCLTLIYT